MGTYKTVRSSAEWQETFNLIRSRLDFGDSALQAVSAIEQAAGGSGASVDWPVDAEANAVQQGPLAALDTMMDAIIDAAYQSFRYKYVIKPGRPKAYTAATMIAGDPSEHCQDGDFSSATHWTMGTGWDITGGEAVATAAANTVTLKQVLADWLRPLQDRQWYLFTFTIVSITPGDSVKAFMGDTYSTQCTSSGTYTFPFYYSSLGVHEFGFKSHTATVTCVIDDVSVVGLPFTIRSDAGNPFFKCIGGGVDVGDKVNVSWRNASGKLIQFNDKTILTATATQITISDSITGSNLVVNGDFGSTCAVADWRYDATHALVDDSTTEGWLRSSGPQNAEGVGATNDYNPSLFPDRHIATGLCQLVSGLEVGHEYTVEFDIKQIASHHIYVLVGRTQEMDAVPAQTRIYDSHTSEITPARTVSVNFVATQGHFNDDGTVMLRFEGRDSWSGTIDNVSIKEAMPVNSKSLTVELSESYE